MRVGYNVFLIICGFVIQHNSFPSSVVFYSYFMLIV